MANRAMDKPRTPLESPTVECLLPFQLPRSPPETHDQDAVDTAPASAPGLEGEDQMLQLYRQAVPLVQPHSSAAVRTLGKIVHDHELVKRMLQRQQPFAEELDRRPVLYESPVHSSSSPCLERSTASPGSALPPSPCSLPVSRSQRRLAFMAACEQLMRAFDPQVAHTRHLKVAQIKPLLRFHALEVDDTAYRRWEQRLTLPSPPVVSVSAFIEACQLWFGESALLQHVRTQQRKPRKLTPLSPSPSPSPQPFEQLSRESHAASSFSYEQHARHPPRLNNSASAPTLLPHAKLCSRLVPESTVLAAAAKLKKARSRQRRQQKQAQTRRRQARLQSAEVARAFSASVAMISRHVHHEEVRELREAERDTQLARAEQSRAWAQLHDAHCSALAQDARAQQMREVCAMKALAQEELQLTRDFRALREDVLRRNKPLFALSASTRTVFQPPPEILAARATASTKADRSRLARVEREHNGHMRSLQLLDFVYDRQRALQDALQPRACASLLELDVRDDELPTERVVELAGEEFWRELLAQQREADGDALAVFVPPTNSPPAALRYFGTSRAVALPGFASAVQRDV